jgi:hypothetical protein
MNITWKISQLERNVSHSGVIRAHWRAEATDGEFTASVYGDVSFDPDPESETFVPFEELTESLVVDWVKQQLGSERVAELEQVLATDIDHQKSPRVVSGTPW